METQEHIQQLKEEIDSYIQTVMEWRGRIERNLHVHLNHEVMEEPNNQINEASQLGSMLDDEIPIEDFYEVRTRFTKLMFGQISGLNR